MRKPASFLVHAGFGAIAISIVVSAGQPVFTDDLWWHLSLGAAFAEAGPWLAADPLLFRAAGPPSTSSWLAEIAFDAVDATAGLTGLRFLHAGWVVAILGLAWSIFRRASKSAWLASLATSGFAILAAYRLVQLRPHLFTLLGVLLLYRLLVEGRRRPAPLRIALAGMLVLVWVNLHGGFLLAIFLLAAASVAEGAAVWLGGAAGRREWGRLAGFGAALALVGLASLFNPAGWQPHLAYLLAGTETPELSRVVDEWKSFGFFQWPVSNLPPTPLAWALGWVLVGLTAVGVVCGLRQWSRVRPGNEAGAIDPALGGLAVASLVAMAIAVRFEWLGIFPLLLSLQVFRRVPDPSARPARAPVAVAASVAVAAVPLFFMLGPWPMISGGLAPYWESYRQAYPAAKYHGHGMGWLADAGLEGHLYTDYSLGGFAGYWLAPRLKTTLNGSLNVAKPVLAAGISLGQRMGGGEGQGFLELLDQYQVDVFFGTGIAHVAPENRPWRYTTAHLEGEDAWVLVFRNVRSAVYLRGNERNRENLARVAAYYRAEGVPFDPARGFDVERVLRSAPRWAFRHGVIPAHFRSLQLSLEARLPNQRWPRQAELARLYAVLGRYQAAVQLDRQRLRSDPSLERVRRRLVWSLLRLGRFDEADRAAEALRAAGTGDGLTLAIAAAAQSARQASSPEEAARLVTLLPLLTLPEAKNMQRGFRVAEPRSRP